MSDRELDEWCFEFELLPAGEDGAVPYQVAEKLMVDLIVPWARAPHYTIGGGFRAAGELWRPRAGAWRYEFGLAAVELGQVVPERDARALMSAIENFAARHGARVQGGYREFTEGDLLLVDPDCLEGTGADEEPRDL
jgi:hypothetical protein